VDTSKSLSGADTHALGKCGDDGDLLVSWENVHGPDPSKKGPADRAVAGKRRPQKTILGVKVMARGAIPALCAGLAAASNSDWPHLLLLAPVAPPGFGPGPFRL